MSSKRRLRRRCLGKIRYPDLATARVAGARLRRTAGRVLSAYRCPLGGHYHVGRPPGITAILAGKRKAS